MATNNAQANEYNATLTDRVEVTPNLLICKVKPDAGSYPFEAGQFAVLGLKRKEARIPEATSEEVPEEKAERLIRRAYSISSASHEDSLEFYLSLVSSGELTPRLFALKEGDRLFLGKSASGFFTLDRVPAGKQILMVATGTGLAPYISMIRTMALGIGCPAVPIAVMHGASYSWDLGYRTELESLARECGHFRYIPVVSRPEEDKDWSGRTGRLNEWMENKSGLEEACGFALDPAKSDIFLCGNPAMVEFGEKHFVENHGYDAGSKKAPGTLHAEKYW
uniref:ferredoxin--NADP(+) reductase n=1 Tax=Magnetococcus massalia (strain MO-1) TaxID=451514 RepID=A0A1S7LNW8_MAGMO|nr:putative Ferredoxin--NADP reductase [Candidatus Magnetococcus massalia]